MADDELQEAEPKTPLYEQRMNIKDRLKEMGKLFDDQREGNDLKGSLEKLEAAASNLQEWDLEGHHLMYSEAMKARKRQLEKFQKIELPFRSQQNEIGTPQKQT